MTEEPTGESRRTFRLALWSRLIVFGAIGVFVVLFVVLNTNNVKVSFVLGSTHLSLIWVILLSLAIGVGLGVLLPRLNRRRQRRR